MQQSQLDPLPEGLPFRIISKTIGRGAYASIKKAIPSDGDSPIFAVKLIHKGHAMRHGRISAKQIAMEVSLHSHVGVHDNIIEWFATGEDNTWKWVAMEYAAGGDLFDKIEADVGVPEDIAHLYFLQLVGGVSFMHSKGVAHRDLKPENVLLSADGTLKIADFGMATLFSHKGQTKRSSTVCGSPPYVAPEVLQCGNSAAVNGKTQRVMSYSADLVDIWSCGVILFVLLIGNTPWDEPTAGSWEFQEYGRTGGRSSDTLWQRLPPDALSLLWGIMNVDADKRFTFAQIRQHPWYTRRNKLLTLEGAISDPLALATEMLSNLRIDLSQAPPATQTESSAAMDVDAADSSRAGWQARFSATQPETPINDVQFDFERHTIQAPKSMALSSTQPTAGMVDAMYVSGSMAAALAEEPTMSQFSQAPGIPLSLTQHARRFGDIVPSYSLTKFYSHVPPQLLVQMLADALHQLNVPTPAPSMDLHSDRISILKVKTIDGRKQSLHGDIIVDKIVFAGGQELLEVRFVKVKGDPLEWRRFFKKMALLCKDGIYKDM